MKSIILASSLLATTLGANAQLVVNETSTAVLPVKEVKVVQSVIQPIVQPVVIKQNVVVPEQHPVDVSVMYRNDRAIEREGMEAQLQYQVTPKVVLGGQVFANQDRVLAYGLNAGVPFKTYNTKVTPYVGVEQYTEDKHRHIDERTATNIGFRTSTPVYKGIGLATDVKYVRGTKNKYDLNDVSYSVGLTKQF